jgi:MATE family multidrug resistance protein
VSRDDSSEATGSEGSWWTSTCGGREVLAIALPLTLSWGLWSLMNLIDRAFLLYHSRDSAAATLNGGMVHWSFVCLPFALASFVNTFVAQYYGAKQKDRIGKIVGQSLLFGVAAIPLFFLTIPIANWIFRVFKQASDGDVSHLIQTEQEYFAGLAYGGGAFVLEATLSAFFTGRGRTSVVLVGSLAATITNLILDYAMIFGEWGFPAWGVFGAGFATALSHWAAVATFVVFALFEQDRADYQLFRGMAFDWELCKRWLRYGVPGALPMAVESVAFTVLLLLISGAGGLATAATAIAFSLNGVSFAPMIGVGVAVATLVGQRLGSNEPNLAQRAVWSGMAIGLTYSVVCGSFYLLMPDTLLRFHRFEGQPSATASINEDSENASHKVTSEDHDELRMLTTSLLQFIAAYCIFDASQIILSNALKGAGDTVAVLVITGGVSILHICGGVVLTRMKLVDGGVYFWWVVLTSWLCCLAVAYLVRFLGGAWRSMRVIEPNLVGNETV